MGKKEEAPKGASNVVNFEGRKGGKVRPPFVPLTGNPEAGDYLDYYNSLVKKDGGDVFDFPDPKE